jgi:hypothetical protein
MASITAERLQDRIRAALRELPLVPDVAIGIFAPEPAATVDREAATLLRESLDVLTRLLAVLAKLRAATGRANAERLSPLIHAAEAESYRRCIFCSAAGRLRRKDRSWVLTLCDRHEACTYHHLDAAFGLVTDPHRDLMPPRMEEIVATLLDERMMLRDKGVLHVGILPPAGTLSTYRLVLELAPTATRFGMTSQPSHQPSAGSSNATMIEHLAIYADHPKSADVAWIF